MKMLVQRVKNAKVSVEGKTTGEIEQGFLVLLGIAPEDTQEIMEKMVDKLLRLRIFSDENDKINLSLSDVGGSLLLVSQFTLYADCRKGNRPSFVHAAPPAQAEALYESCKAYCRERVPARAIVPALSMLHRRRRRRHCTNPVRRTAGSVFRWWSPASSAQICRWSCAMTVRLPSCWIRMRS